MINDRIAKLRSVMKERGIYAYIIPSADYHQSEYVGEFFKGRQFISGFTGSVDVENNIDEYPIAQPTSNIDLGF